MESLYLLIPLSTLLVLGILLVFAWAVQGGQFEDVQAEGERILQDTAAALDTDQGSPPGGVEQSVTKAGPAAARSVGEGAN